MDPLTIGLVAMGCSLIIAATNLTMCSLQTCTAVKKSYDGDSTDSGHNLSDDHHKAELHDDHPLVELVGKVIAHEWYLAYLYGVWGSKFLLSHTEIKDFNRKRISNLYQ